jgi:hypothetical protein
VYSCCPYANIVTLLLAALGGLVPTALVAVTVNVYESEGVNPEIVIGPAPEEVPVSPPGFAVAV